MEEEGARGEAMGEQIGGGKAVLKQGMHWLAKLFRIAHWQKWPVEPNHLKCFFLLQKKSKLNIHERIRKKNVD